jgi:hypothetical protein
MPYRLSRRLPGGSTFSVALALLLAFHSPADAVNALAGNPSPYLAMHGQDPVDWREWGPAALEEARETGRPLFVSSGVTSCSARATGIPTSRRL